MAAGPADPTRDISVRGDGERTVVSIRGVHGSVALLAVLDKEAFGASPTDLSDFADEIERAAYDTLAQIDE